MLTCSLYTISIDATVSRNNDPPSTKSASAVQIASETPSSRSKVPDCGSKSMPSLLGCSCLNDVVESFSSLLRPYHASFQRRPKARIGRELPHRGHTACQGLCRFDCPITRPGGPNAVFLNTAPSRGTWRSPLVLLAKRCSKQTSLCRQHRALWRTSGSAH